MDALRVAICEDDPAERERLLALLKGITVLMELSVAAAVVLQLAGAVSFHRSLYYFHALLPSAIVVLTGAALYEYLRWHNRAAGRFFMPFLVLAVATLLELLNYRLRFMPQFSALFQAGMFMFVLAMAAFTVVSLRDLYDLRLKNLALENEVKLQEQTIAAQKKHSALLLLSHYEEIRRQRHDIRHHLRTLDDMLRRGDADGAGAYVRSLVEAAPGRMPEKLCDNVIVNATLSYYAWQATASGIRLELRAQVPEGSPHISDAALCVIFGNLLENALEACRRVGEGERRIALDAQVRGETLFIAMDNSYDGNVHSADGRFYSSKREGFGTGLRSIQTLAEAHGGGADFKALEGAFRSEVFVQL